LPKADVELPPNEDGWHNAALVLAEVALALSFGFSTQLKVPEGFKTMSSRLGCTSLPSMTYFTAPSISFRICWARSFA
jgi:hypothetical protein